MSEFIYGLLLVLICASVALNVHLHLKMKRLKRAPTESLEVRDLLHDLTAGEAFIQVKRVDPASVFLRRRQ